MLADDSVLFREGWPGFCAERPGTGVLVLSQYVETRQTIRLIKHAPQRVGYLLKDRVSDIAEFADAVRRIACGGSVIDPDVVARLLRRREQGSVLDQLTDRERDIRALIAEGCSNHAFCQQLFLSPKTVETHVVSIFTKLGLLPSRCSRCASISPADGQVVEQDRSPVSTDGDRAHHRNVTHSSISASSGASARKVSSGSA